MAELEFAKHSEQQRLRVIKKLFYHDEKDIAFHPLHAESTHKGLVRFGRLPKRATTRCPLTDEQRAYVRMALPDMHILEGAGAHDHPIAHLCDKLEHDRSMDWIGPHDRVLDLFGRPEKWSLYNQKQQVIRDRELSYRYKWFEEYEKAIPGAYKEWLLNIVQNDPTWPVDDRLDLMHNPTYEELDTRAPTALHGLIESWVEEVTTKDSIRSLNWDNDYAVQGRRCWPLSEVDERIALEQVPAEAFARYDKFLAHHTLYYLHPRQVAKMLQYGGVMRAIVHRFQFDRGSFYGGELTYTKDEFGVVTQVNPAGESYVHRDTEFWFTRNGWTNGDLGIAWTVSQGVGDSWEIIITNCPPEIVTPPLPVHAEASEGFLLLSQGRHQFFVKTSERRLLRISNGKFLNALLQQVAGRPRDEGTFRDLAGYARRITNPNKLFAEAQYYWVDPEHIMDHVYLAFSRGTAREVNLMSNFENPLFQKHTGAFRKRYVWTGGSVCAAVRCVVQAASLATMVKHGKFRELMETFE